MLGPVCTFHSAPSPNGLILFGAKANCNEKICVPLHIPRSIFPTICNGGRNIYIYIYMGSNDHLELEPRFVKGGGANVSVCMCVAPGTCEVNSFAWPRSPSTLAPQASPGSLTIPAPQGCSTRRGRLCSRTRPKSKGSEPG